MLVKDGDDVRNLEVLIMGQGCVVGGALVFAGIMTLQAALVTRCELRNKRAREEVAQRGIML
jgi:ATP-binding cassette subfamily B (MDR/TAP) protein 1